MAWQNVGPRSASLCATLRYSLSLCHPHHLALSQSVETINLGFSQIVTRVTAKIDMLYADDGPYTGG